MSETDFLKLKKHDNVETNTEKFNIENYLNGNWDKINKNAKEVNTKISNINSNNTELEKELKEIQDDFYQNSIRGQASGEYIHVEDSSNCRAKIGIGGNSEQETRSGKNLLELMEGTYSNNGITAVVKNGIVTLNGASTAISFVGINLLKNFNLIAGNTYHLNAFNTGVVGDSSNNLCSLRLNGEGTKETTLNKTNSNNAITGDFLLTYITIRTAQGITYNNFVVKPQLELGTGTSTWEQGGVSPSPDYLSKVVAVGGNVQLLDKNNANKLSAFINGDTKVITSFESCKTLYVSCVKNTYYTVKRKVGTRFIVGTTTNKPTANITCNQTAGNNTADSITIKTSNTDNYLVVFYYNSGSDTLTEQEILDSIKIVEGTEVGEYSKYGQGCINVVICNDNLFDKNNLIPYTIIPRSNGVAITNNSSNYETYNATDFIPVKENTNYFINFTFASSNYGWCFYDKNKNFISGIEPNVKSFATPKETAYLRFCYDKNRIDTNTIQLVEGSTEKPYVEHKEQIYTIPTQQEMLEGDYFDFDNEEEVHGWNKLILDGTESITLNSNYNDCTLFELVKSDCYVVVDTKKYAKSNYFISGNKDLLASNSGSNMVGLGTSKGRIWINISNSIVGTSDKLNNFKTFLKSKYDEGTPVTIYYKLATPTRLKFTEEQKAVAKELNNARTYKNVTNITTDSKAILDLDYAKDLETLLTSKESEV